MFFLLLSTAPLLSALQFPAALLHRPHCPTTSAPHALCSLFPTRDPKLIPSLISPPPLLGATAAAGWFVPTGHPPDGAGRGAPVLARHGKTSSNHGKNSREVQRGEEWQGDTSKGSTRAVTVTKEGEGESRGMPSGVQLFTLPRSKGRQRQLGPAVGAQVHLPHVVQPALEACSQEGTRASAATCIHLAVSGSAMMQG